VKKPQPSLNKEGNINMTKTKVNITDLEILEIEKQRKIKKDGLNNTAKKLKTCVIVEILKNHTTLLESFLEKPK
jgi:hypothetical protein